MKFEKQAALKIIKNQNLDKRYFALWKKRGRIPKKHYQNPVIRVVIDKNREVPSTQDLERMRELLNLKWLKRAALTSTEKHTLDQFAARKQTSISTIEFNQLRQELSRLKNKINQVIQSDRDEDIIQTFQLDTLKTYTILKEYRSLAEKIQLRYNHVFYLSATEKGILRMKLLEFRANLTY